MAYYESSIYALKDIQEELSDISFKEWATGIILPTNDEIYVAESVAYINKKLSNL